MKIDANSFMKGKRKAKVCFPLDISNEDHDLIGYYQEESNYYNIVALDNTQAFILESFMPIPMKLTWNRILLSVSIRGILLFLEQREGRVSWSHIG